jgi:hypothetical protein
MTTLHKILSHDCKKCMQILIFVAWLYLSFSIPYYMTTEQIWHSFLRSFMNYSIYFQIISTLAFAYLITGGHRSQTMKHIKSIIVFTSISIVLAFTMLRWTTLTTEYGEYGHYVDGAPSGYLHAIDGFEGSPFEKETIYREAIVQKYNSSFMQIIVFMVFMFSGTFLILKALDERKQD